MPVLTVTKTFTPSTISTGGISVLTITLTNPNGVPSTGVMFTDSYPPCLINATPASPTNGAGGALTATNGGTSLSLVGGTVPANSTVSITVNVTNAVLCPTAVIVNSVVVMSDDGTSAPATGILTVIPPLPPTPVKKKKKRNSGGYVGQNTLCFNRNYIENFYPNSCQPGGVIYYSNTKIPYVFSNIDQNGNCCFTRADSNQF